MPFSSSDTIVAIATPPGRGGIGVVRVSGPEAAALVGGLIDHSGTLEPRRALFTRLSAASAVRDQIIVTSFPAPHSYTGENVVELSAHGSPVILHSIVAAAMSLGARLAEPGEFTLRAFLNGRIDLIQAEAVADLIDAVTPEQARLAFDQLEGTSTRAIADLEDTLFDLSARLEASVDFPDEGYHFVARCDVTTALCQLIERMSSLLADFRRGRLVREGLQVAIVGRPNVGKSSLFNALVGSERAIVTDRPGTTRDLVSEVVDIRGLKVTLVDTAGVRDTSDPAEAEGVSRSRQAERVADLVLVVVDQDEPVSLTEKHFVVQSKSDLGRPDRGIRVSATTGEGLEELRRAMTTALDVEFFRDRPQITNIRHAALLERAMAAVTRARDAAQAETPASEEFVLADLQEARNALEEMTGRRTPEDLLAHIFSRFCVGK